MKDGVFSVTIIVLLVACIFNLTPLLSLEKISNFVFFSWFISFTIIVTFSVFGLENVCKMINKLVEKEQ